MLASINKEDFDTRWIIFGDFNMTTSPRYIPPYFNNISMDSEKREWEDLMVRHGIWDIMQYTRMSWTNNRTRIDRRDDIFDMVYINELDSWVGESGISCKNEGSLSNYRMIIVTLSMSNKRNCVNKIFKLKASLLSDEPTHNIVRFI